MKKVIVLMVLGFICKLSHAAAPLVAEAPIMVVGTPVTISISSTTLTKVPSSQMTGRMGLFLENPFTNSGRFAGFLGDCNSTALANTIRPIEIGPTTNSTFYSIREDICLWLVSTDTTTASASAHYQEVRQ